MSATPYNYARCEHGREYYVAMWTEWNEKSAEQQAGSWELLLRVDAQRIADWALEGMFPDPVTAADYVRRRDTYYASYRELRAWQDARRIRAENDANTAACLANAARIAASVY